jgi:DNA replication and repair protein RecF
MILENLKLINFKNYSSCSLEFNPRFNFIYGDNGQGKTNILEAISLLCLTKSFLQNPETYCVKYGECSFDIMSDSYNAGETRNNAKFSFNRDILKKEITFNNEVVQKFNKFLGVLPLVVLSPADLNLTSGTPGDKRRNFDILISQIDKIYLNDLKSYTKIVKQKNSLLRDNVFYKKYDKSELVDLLDSWNVKLVEFGVKIILKRFEFICEFREYFKNNFYNIVNDNVDPQIHYKSDILDSDNIKNIDIVYLNQYFKDILLRKMNLELLRGVSLVGPHRDNYIFSILKNNQDFELRNFGSQGEHKTFIVALKIAEYQYLKSKLNDSNIGDPVILLDDLFSELDSTRTEKIASMLTKLNQIFLTTTDKKYLDVINKYFSRNEITSFFVINGTAQRISRF